MRHKSIKQFELQWKNENKIHIEVTDPDIVWEMELGTTAFLNLVNTIITAMPRWKWTFPFQKRMNDNIAKKNWVWAR